MVYIDFLTKDYFSILFHEGIFFLSWFTKDYFSILVHEGLFFFTKIIFQ
jgi:hypothetical protein